MRTTTSVGIVVFIASIGAAGRPDLLAKEPKNEALVPSQANEPPAASLLATQADSEGGPYRGENDRRWESWRQMERRDPSFQWKIPIRFYGIVLDESDKPVQGATIRFGWNDVSGSKEQFGVSGPDGKFQLSGIRGKILTVKASKDGYHASGSKAGQAFEYAAFFEPIYHEPDAAKPVVFRLIRELSAERLIGKRRYKNLSYNRRWYFNFQTGLLTSVEPTGPALGISCIRSESSRVDPFDWNLVLEGMGLKMRPIDVEFVQLAPETGYAETWEVAYGAKTKPFPSSMRQRLYIQTKENKFGWFEIEIMHPNDRSLGPTVGITSYLNPTGSRVIQVDPRKLVDRP